MPDSRLPVAARQSGEHEKSGLYAMQRANGDWFALDDNGRLRMPVFLSSSAALHARSHHPGMFLFKPTVFDGRALEGLALIDGGNDVSFWLVDDPFVNLSRGRSLNQVQFDQLIHKAAERLQSKGR